MGNALVCFEHGQWDSHHNVTARYKPAAAPKQDMTQPLSHYFISRYDSSTHDSHTRDSSSHDMFSTCEDIMLTYTRHGHGV
jgi:hypothetical protein